MRIGIVPNLDETCGGVYQYSLTMLRELVRATEVHAGDDEFVVFASDIRHPGLSSVAGRPGWSLCALPPALMNKQPASPERLRDLVRHLLEKVPFFWGKDEGVARRHPHNRDLWVRFQAELSDFLQSQGIELMLYPFASELAFETALPYVMAIHDLQHRLQPRFPEVSANGQGEVREYLFRNCVRFATQLLADSQTGKEDILNCYGDQGVTEDSIKILPFLAGIETSTIVEKDQKSVRTKYRLPKRFLFYPAHFWTHKNHSGIVRALEILKREKQIAVPVVLCGSHAGDVRHTTYGEVMDLANKLRVQDLIAYLGYLPEAEVSAMYSAAVALIMPTFFGPTNIPIIEAWRLNCPVITSDIRGVREQVGDAAILADPDSPESIADAIARLWNDPALRQTLIERGQRRLCSYGPSEFRARLLSIIEEAKERVRADRTRNCLPAVSVPLSEPCRGTMGWWGDGWASPIVRLRLSPGTKLVAIGGFLPGSYRKLRGQAVKIVCDGDVVREVRLSGGDFELQIPVRSRSPEHSVEIRLEASRHIVPKKMGTSEDERELAYQLREIRWE